MSDYNDDSFEDQEQEERKQKARDKRENIIDKAKRKEGNLRNKADKKGKQADKAKELADKFNQKSLNQAQNGNKLRSAINKRRAGSQAKKAEKFLKQSQKAAKAANQLGKFAKTAAKLAKIIGTIGWIILLVMIIIGLLIFVLAGLGMIWGAIQQILEGIADWWTSFTQGSENIVKEEDIADVLTNLQEMGYDLYGYGFTTYVDPLSDARKKEIESHNADIEDDEDKDEEKDEKDDEEKDDDEVTGDDVIAYAKQFVGNPYVYGGSSLTNGCDCSGFVMKVYEHFGVTLPHSSHADRTVGDSVSESDMKAGDIVCYNSSSSPTGGHVGLYDGNGKIVEAQSSNTGITDTRDVNHAIIVAIRRIKDIKPGSGGGGDNDDTDSGLRYEGKSSGYDIIRTYLISDNYSNLIKNNNKNINQAFSSAKNFFAGLFGDKTKWGTGLISLYYDTETLGERAGAQRNSEFFGHDNTDAWIENGKLVIKTGMFTNGTFQYDLDGWTGRYGMPLEFLLSVHIATLSPDLGVRLATSFDTDVEILLHKSTGQAKMGVASEPGQGKYLTKDEFKNINSGKSKLEVIYTLYKVYGITNPKCEEDTKCWLKVEEAVKAAEEKKNKENDEKDNEDEEEVKPDLSGLDACSSCKDLLDIIEDVLGLLGGNTSETYVPYINRVTDHWFRNVYFTIAGFNQYNAENTDNPDQITQSDIVYEKKTGERWSLYETYDGDSSGYTLSSDYKLYTYLPNSSGEYDVTNTSGNNKTDEGYWASNGTEILCKYVGDEKGKYKLKEDGITFTKCTGKEKGDYNLVLNDSSYSEYTPSDSEAKIIKEYGFRATKKAIIETDLSGIFEDGENNTAYVFEEANGSAGWEPYQTEGDEEPPEAIQRLQDNGAASAYTQADFGKVTQVEDGVRGSTNATIKNIFLDEYYLYDGTRSKAGLINMAKTMTYAAKTVGASTVVDAMNSAVDKAKEDKKSLELTQLNDFLDNNTVNLINTLYNIDSTDPNAFIKAFDEDTEIKTYIKNDEDDEEGQVYTATIDQLKGPISISKTALNAFSILENLHTLDAEYIYRDFKELIVELNYFDKEDLADVPTQTMMFPVSGIDSQGWPDEKYDKAEEFYGTLIESSDDYEAQRATEDVEFQKLMATTDEDEEEDTGTPDTTNYGEGDYSSTVCEDDSCFRNVVANGVEYKQFYQFDYGSVNIDGHKGLDGGCGICSTASMLTGYGEDVDPPKVVEKKTELGLKWYPDGGQRADNIQKILASYGIGGEWKPSPSSSDTKQILKDAFAEGKPVIVRVGAPGGTKFSTSGGHYICVVGESEDGKLYTCDSGNRSDSQRSVYDGGVEGFANDVGSTLKGIFVPDKAPDGSATSEETEEDPIFAGYEGDDPVVAPVTGKVLKYGTVKRTNAKTGLEEEVGFIKIKALDVKDLFNKNKVDVTKNDVKGTNPPTAAEWLEGAYDKEKLKTLGYDYFFEEYEKAAINGYVMYLEGFRPIDGVEGVEKGNIKSLKDYIEESNPDEDDSSNTSSADDEDDEHEPGSYSTAYIVPEMEDEVYEFELKVAEEAKREAVYVTELGGDVYIKEGAVIGHTYSEENPSDGMKEEKIEVLDTYQKPENNTDEENQTTTENTESQDEKTAKEKLNKLIEEQKEKYEGKENQYSTFVDYLKVTAGKGGITGQNGGELVYKKKKDKFVFKYGKTKLNATITEDGVVTTKKQKFLIGNYMRLIFRDRDDEVVENVEDYIELGETKKSIGTEVSEKLLFFLGVLEEGACTGKYDLGDYYGFEVLKDGAGNTTAFGLTKAVQDQGKVPEMYPDFAKHLLSGKVPKKEAQDVFVLVCEAAREAVLNQINDTSKLSEDALCALIDLYHASPCKQLPAVVDIFNKTGKLTVKDFEDHWGTNTNYPALMDRGHNRGILATTGVYQRYNGSQGPHTVIDFKSETPWSEFCDGADPESLYAETGGGQ